MLVLSRKVDERIRVGDEVTITVVRISPGVVRIGIDAPPHLAIVRDELVKSDAPDNRKSALSASR
ncbi:MAG TPA: carbon storage regulator [Pirellulales bacterium]|nr:carbon storage regulator [Pirellulales bacterium]